MTADQTISQIIKYLRMAVLVAILVLLAATILRLFGVSIPIRSIGHVELAYLAGVYWLTK